MSDVDSTDASTSKPEAVDEPLCQYCNKPARGWSSRDLRYGSRWTGYGKEYHCREAAVGD